MEFRLRVHLKVKHKPMTTKSIFLILLFAVSANLLSQTKNLNQTDSSGKKNGKWFVYLDKDWAELKDSSKAVYFRYTYFDSGTNVYPMGPCGKKGYKLETTTTGKLLDGEYKWFDAKGRLSSVHILKMANTFPVRNTFLPVS